MLKILLFGASGQLGREWQAFFASHGEDKITLNPYTSQQLDLTRHDEVEHEVRRQQPDWIINCAAYTRVDQAEEEREKARRVNARSVQHLAEICDRARVKLVHFSTDYIFAGTKKDGGEFPAGYPEDHPANPVNWYGQTKWEGEQAIRAVGCEHLVMRVSWLCSCYGNNFVKTMLRLAEDHKELDIVEDQFGSPTFARNLVENTFKLIEEDKNGTYHLCSRGLISWADFAEAIFGFAGADVEVNHVASNDFPTKAARPHFSKLDTAKIEKVENILIVNWKNGLRRLLDKITD